MTGVRLLLVLAFVGYAARAVAAENLVANPRFEMAVKPGGRPDHWQLSGDGRLVTQTLTIDRGREGRSCARLTCARFQGGNPAAHAMLCQMGVPVERGKTYRVAFWARAENFDADVASIALSDMAGWVACGLQGSFAPSAQWQPFEFVFQATRNCDKTSRFQIWFASTGTLWIDDVRFEKADRDMVHPGHVIRPGSRANLVPNASFECGTDGWGSADWDRAGHWGGPLNQLFGAIDDQEACDGRQSLRIELTPKNQPVSYFDYYELSRAPVRAPLAANIGLLEVQPGRQYTLSVFMKARQSGTPAGLAVREFHGRTFQRTVEVSNTWQRYSLSFKPSTRWCYVLAGPDLQPHGDRAPPQSATLWLDAVQLEQAVAPAAFTTREPVEIGVSTSKPGNVFGWGEPLQFQMAVGNAGTEPRDVTVELTMTDFFDKEVRRQSLRVRVAGASRAERHVSIPPAGELRGFLRLHVKSDAGGAIPERTLRLAAIPINERDDSRFGVNHAYPWPHLLDLCHQAGLVWVRDWSLKWQEVEPVQGRFEFGETDFQIDRPLRHGLHVLGLLPFPSSNWSSSAPASVEVTKYYPGNRARVAYAPRSEAAFENYVEQTVKHYRDRIGWWQVFNEPLYTDYSLPRKHGYGGDDYARLTKAFAKAAKRADPKCHIVAGIGGLNEGQILDDFDRFFAAGVLPVIDAVDIHHYPTLRRPEAMEGLLAKLNALMDKQGGRKPIWLTEYGYYADDEPAAIPIAHQSTDQPLPNERMQAEYAVRWAVILLAGGTEKIFYHAGVCCGVNGDSLEGIFFKYAGQPRKIYPAQAMLANLLGPTCRFVKRLPIGEGVRCYLFRDGARLVALVWADRGAKARSVRLASEKMRSYDLMGRPQSVQEFTPGSAPVYIVADGLSDDAFAAELQ